MDAREISQLLARSADTVTAYLLPHGHRDGKEWVAGSIHGEKGSSLKVRLDGPKTGVWADFATGEKGDLLDLWKLTQNLSFVEALKAAKAFLGIQTPEFVSPPRKAFSRPKPEKGVKSDAVAAYLTVERKLSLETLKAFKVGSLGSESFNGGKIVSDAYYLPYYRGETLCHWKKIGLSRTETGKKLVKTSADTEHILFGWQAITPNDTRVVICEGEIDAMSFYQHGIPALSVPFGGGSGNKQEWVENEYPYLERFREIFICFDSDEEGQKGAMEILKRLGSHRCQLVDIGFKDANEAHILDLGNDYFEACLEEAKFLDPSELKDASVYVDDVIKSFNPDNSKPEGERLPWRVGEHMFFRPDEISIWTGINGHGKSQMLGQVLLEFIKQDAKVCIASMELKPVRLLNRLTRQATAMREPSDDYIRAVFEWLAGKVWLFELIGTAKAERLLEVFRYASKRYGITHFVIDSLMKCGIPEDDYRGQKAFIDQLADFKHEYNCHVHLVAHSRKGESEGKPVGKLDVKGTGGITDVVDNCLSVWRNKSKEEESRKPNPDPEKMDRPDALLIVDKHRNGEWEGKIPLWFDVDSFQYLGSSNEEVRRYVGYSRA